MLMPVRGALNEMDDSERKDDARTKSHESFCGQDALPVLWVQRFTALFASVARGPFSSMPPPGPWHTPGSRPARSCRSRTSAREPACRREPDTIQGRDRRSERPSDSAPVAAREPRPPLPLRPRPADPSVARPRWAGEESTSGSSWGARLPDRVTRRHTEARRASETPRRDATAPLQALEIPPLDRPEHIQHHLRILLGTHDGLRDRDVMGTRRSAAAYVARISVSTYGGGDSWTETCRRTAAKGASTTA